MYPRYRHPTHLPDRGCGGLTVTSAGSEFSTWPLYFLMVTSDFVWRFTTLSSACKLLCTRRITFPGGPRRGECL